MGHFFLALIYAESDPDRARKELAVVAELNPLEPRIERSASGSNKPSAERAGLTNPD